MGAKKKKILIIINAVLMLAFIIVVFYLTVLKESYIPYKWSGIDVSGSVIKTEHLFDKSHGIYTPDGETCFIYLTSTLYSNLSSKPHEAIIAELSDEGQGRITENSDSETGNITCKEIYYLSEKCVKQFQEGKYSKLTKENIAAIKADSTLVWRGN